MRGQSWSQQKFYQSTFSRDSMTEGTACALKEATDKALEPSIKTEMVKHQVSGLSFKNANDIWAEKQKQKHGIKLLSVSNWNILRRCFCFSCVRFWGAWNKERNHKDSLSLLNRLWLGWVTRPVHLDCYFLMFPITEMWQRLEIKLFPALRWEQFMNRAPPWVAVLFFFLPLFFLLP